MTALEAYILAKAYTQQAIAGAGALKGAPCQIQSITPITGGNRITFAWENSEGETETDTLDVMDGVDGTNGTDGTDGTDGVGISSITFKEKDASGNNVYTVTLTNTNTYDITCPIGPQGETGATGATGATGNGISSITKTGTAGLVDTYTITYTNGQTSTFTVTNGAGNNEFIGTLAEWNNLTTAEKKEYDTYQITDDFTGCSGGVNYSTTEQALGIKWIDGKEIYRKVVDFGALPNTTTKDVSSGLTAANVNIIKMDCVARGVNGATIPVPYVSYSANNIADMYFMADGNIRIQTYNDRSSQSAYVILEYTKATT